MSEIKITVKEYKHLLSIMFCAETSLESEILINQKWLEQMTTVL